MFMCIGSCHLFPAYVQESHLKCKSTSESTTTNTKNPIVPCWINFWSRKSIFSSWNGCCRGWFGWCWSAHLLVTIESITIFVMCVNWCGTTEATKVWNYPERVTDIRRKKQSKNYGKLRITTIDTDNLLGTKVESLLLFSSARIFSLTVSMRTKYMLMNGTQISLPLSYYHHLAYDCRSTAAAAAFRMYVKYKVSASSACSNERIYFVFNDNRNRKKNNNSSSDDDDNNLQNH